MARPVHQGLVLHPVHLELELDRIRDPAAPRDPVAAADAALVAGVELHHPHDAPPPLGPGAGAFSITAHAASRGASTSQVDRKR